MPGTNGQFRGMAPLATLYSVAASMAARSNFITDQYLQEAPALTNALISNNSWNYDGDNAYDLDGGELRRGDARRAADGDRLAAGAVRVLGGQRRQRRRHHRSGQRRRRTALSRPPRPRTSSPSAPSRSSATSPTDVTNADGTIGEPWQARNQHRVTASRDFPAAATWASALKGHLRPVQAGRGRAGDVHCLHPLRPVGHRTYFYQSPTNYNVQDLSVVLPADALGLNEFPIVPTNTVQVSIELVPNGRFAGAISLPAHLRGLDNLHRLGFFHHQRLGVHPWQSRSSGGYLQSIMNSEFGYGFNYGISNSTPNPSTSTSSRTPSRQTTRGIYFLVLSNLNQSLGAPNPRQHRAGAVLPLRDAARACRRRTCRACWR